ncbi:MAG: sulfur carrier protein ThiS [Hyphomicrobiales bacterium]|nr:sulfur carrier protein ThiS [Hyphomicrobiales bacterium]
MTQMARQGRIQINGQEEPLSATTVLALLAQKAIDTEQRGIAVALNGSVVPRAAWATTPLNAGDSIEIVRARQGG